MFKALNVLVIAVPAVVAATMLISVPAADAAVPGCEPNRFCAWSSDGQAGTRVSWAQGVNDPNWGLNANLHDDAESLQNAAVESSVTPDSVQTYFDTFYRRAGICLLPGESADSDMADNAYDSHRWIQSCG